MHHHHFSLTSFIVIAIISALILIALSVILFILYAKKKKRARDSDDAGITAILHAQSHHLSDVEMATDGFDMSRVVGKGPLGTVYKAVSAAGCSFAVKRIHPHLVLSNPGVGFSAKMKSLSYANHPNVVAIIGYSEAPGERLIISEFIGTGSLDYYLHRTTAGDDGSLMPRLLNWPLRLSIAAGAARGLEYLHEGTLPSIVHGCVTSKNIMIDVNFSPRVCDYGLSFLLAPSDRGGMEGYMDGEGNAACKENDVYSFGIVLLELLTGRRCEGGKLVHWALGFIRAQRVAEVLDERIETPSDMKPLMRLAKVASTCVGNGRKSRPTIAQVAAILNSLEVQPCM